MNRKEGSRFQIAVELSCGRHAVFVCVTQRTKPSPHSRVRSCKEKFSKIFSCQTIEWVFWDRQ
jgi:hypothetical protein